MSFIKSFLFVLFLFVVSCTGSSVNEDNNIIDDKKIKPKVENNDDAVTKENKNNVESSNDAKTENTGKKKDAESEKTTKKPENSPTKTDELEPKFEFKLLDTEKSRQIRIQTEHSYIEINFNTENSILDFFSDDLTETGKKHIKKICVDYIEFYYDRIAKWLQSGESKPAYDGICLVLHELADNADVQSVNFPEKMKEFPVIMMNLKQFNTNALIRGLWINLLPIESKIIKTGLAYVNPSIKKIDIVEYYKFMPVMRMCVKYNDFFMSSSPFGRQFYDFQRADLVSYMLENSDSIKDFLETAVDDEAFKKMYSDWRKNRKQFFDNDKLPEHFNSLYKFEKGNCANGFRILQKIDKNSLKTEDGDFLQLVELMFFANQYDYIRRYLNEQVLTVDFLMNRMPKKNKAILYNQFRVPISVLITSIFQNDIDFNKDLAVYLDKLGYVVMSKFLLYSENILSDIDILRESGIKEVEEFLKKLPPCYKTELTWWYCFLRMVSELKFGFVSVAKGFLAQLSKISVTNLQIEQANFAYELFSK